MRRGASYILRMVAVGALMLCAAEVGQAQLNENCTVSVLNRTVRVNPDGSWVLPNIPANFGQVKARVTCVRNGVTTSGESDFFTVPANGSVNLPPIVMGSTTQIPASLGVTPAKPSFNASGQTTQLLVTATYPDGSTRNVTAANTGTNYTTSNPAIAAVNADGLLTAVASGTVVIQAVNDGATGIITANVILASADSDGDSIPDDAESSLGLDPHNAVDAQEDFDRDGLTNLQEYSLGTDMRNPDRDGDGLSDGDEVNKHHTNPFLADTDGDSIPDGVEVQTGSNPLDRNSYDLKKATASSVLKPASFLLATSVLSPNPSQQLSWKINLIDGKTTLDLTADARTNYSSSDLTVCNFGAQKGLVFAGNPGGCSINISNGTLSAAVTGTVQSFTPKALSFVDIPGFANNVDVVGNYAYVAAGSAGLQVVDVSDHSHPRVMASRGLPGNADDVAVAGSYAYVAAGSAGLQIVDISNPLAPVMTGSLNTGGVAWDVVIKGSRAYVANGTGGLVLIDVSTPSSPVRLGSLTLPGTSKGVDVDTVRQIAAVALGGNGLAIVNVATPASPALLATLAGGDVRDLAISGDYVFLADSLRSFTSVDLTNPSLPVLRASTAPSLGGLLQDVVVNGSFAAGADVFFVNGVPMIEVSTPAGPQPRTILDFSSFRDDNGTGVAMDSSYVYLTAEAGNISENGVSGATRLYIAQYRDFEDNLGVSPTVQITSPASGVGVIQGSTVTMTVNAADDVAVAAVSFLLNGQVVSTSTTAPYQYTLTAPGIGSTLTLGATAVDFGGNVGQAANVTLNLIPDLPPTVQITSPSPGTQVIQGGTLTVTANAADDVAVAAVNFFVNGQLASTATAAPYSYTLTAPGNGSTLTLGATAVDGGGKVGQASDVVLNLIPDPLTTVVGRVVNAGQPVAGVRVTAFGSFSTTTAGDGSFAIAGVPTVRGDIVVTANFTQTNGSVVAGVSSPAAPVRSGTTNVGDILVSESRRLLISEFRFRGPSGGLDEFVELYNNSNSPITVADSGSGAGFGVVGTNTTGFNSLRCTIPNGTVIPARGHFLCTNNGANSYSLGGYAAGDATYATGIVDGGGVAVFSTTVAANWSTATRLDAVGFSGIAGTTLFTEGTPLSSSTGVLFNIDYSFARKMTPDGLPQDTDNNAADFLFADTQGTFISGFVQRLGAPGPENLSSPVRGPVTGVAGITVAPVDPAAPPFAAPNLVRDFTSDPPNNGTFGVIRFRLKVTNNTGQNLTRLRFRVTDLTTFSAPNGTADLRPRTSANIPVLLTGGGNVVVQGTTLEQPPNQPNGGGFNSTLSAGTVTLATPLAPGATINLQFVVGVQQTGAYRFSLNIETLPLSNTETIIFTGQTN